MDHAEYLRLFPDADVAVLFVHGILGSPRHFDLFLPVIPPKWSVQCLLLDGHGKGVKDFSKSSPSLKPGHRTICPFITMPASPKACISSRLRVAFLLPSNVQRSLGSVA